MAGVKKFGGKLKELRLARGWTLGRVAREIGVSVSYLSDVERGYRNPFSVETIKEVARMLAADEDELLGLASSDRGRLELETNHAGVKKIALAGALQRRWDGMTEQEATRILLNLNDRTQSG